MNWGPVDGHSLIPWLKYYHRNHPEEQVNFDVLTGTPMTEEPIPVAAIGVSPRKDGTVKCEMYSHETGTFRLNEIYSPGRSLITDDPAQYLLDAIDPSNLSHPVGTRQILQTRANDVTICPGAISDAIRPRDESTWRSPDAADYWRYLSDLEVALRVRVARFIEFYHGKPIPVSEGGTGGRFLKEDMRQHFTIPEFLLGCRSGMLRPSHISYEEP